MTEAKASDNPNPDLRSKSNPPGVQTESSAASPVQAAALAANTLSQHGFTRSKTEQNTWVRDNVKARILSPGGPTGDQLQLVTNLGGLPAEEAGNERLLATVPLTEQGLADLEASLDNEKSA